MIALCIYGFVTLLEKQEHAWLLDDLSQKAMHISQREHEPLRAAIVSEGRDPGSAALLERVTHEEGIKAVDLCSVRGQPVGGRLLKHPPDVSCERAVRSYRSSGSGVFVRTGVNGNYLSIEPVLTQSRIVGYLVMEHDTTRLEHHRQVIQVYLASLLSILFLIFLSVTVLVAVIVHRWSRTESVHRFKSTLKALVSGNFKSVEDSLKATEFAPIVKDLSKVIREMRKAKQAPIQVALDPSWTPTRLRAEVQRYFGDAQLCVIANREPYVHNRKGNRIEVHTPASGLVTAVEPIVRACSGLWIAHGSGSADRATADRSGKLLVPPQKPEYALKRVWLSKAEEQGYYYGFSNEGLWPLCHIAHTRPHFDSEDWKMYHRVNEKFAQAFAEEHAKSDRPIVLIQDYHFALLPGMIRRLRPDAVLSLFWHIPWPNPETIGICPWKKELLRGMLGADLIGFHTQYHCNNFLDTVDRYLEARVDRENFSVTIQGHVCYVKPFSISVEWPSRFELPVERFAAEREELLAELNLPRDVQMGIGIDRVDYTKGLIERLESVERLLDRHPELVGKFVFVQIGAPSRTHIKRYQDLNAEVQETADRINWKFHNAEVPPILLKLSHHDAQEVNRYYRAADICFVSSLHDGMNLVAKEYVAARKDQGGVLVLSTFTGASRELTDALLVNPYDLDECAEALYLALTMPKQEREQRMSRLRRIVSEKNVYAWAGSFLGEVYRIAQATPSSTAARLGHGLTTARSERLTVTAAASASAIAGLDVTSASLGGERAATMLRPPERGPDLSGRADGASGTV